MKLKDIDTRAPTNFEKESTIKETAKIADELNDLQNKLYAEGKRALLVVLQGMDGSGKDRTIRRVFSKTNPLGVDAYAFKAPTAIELAHDFLWRIHEVVPAKGTMTIFNRSHYEDIVITRVHEWCDDDTAKKRMKAINDFESLLVEHNNTTILKFYLHISREEQLKRLNERTKDPAKRWKYSKKDFDESELWDKYMHMYEDVFEHCNKVPWSIVPADQKWYKDYVVAKTVRHAFEEMKLEYPS